MKFHMYAVTGTAVLLATCQMAYADTTTLVCKLDSANPWKENEPTTIELNEAQASVVIHFSAKILSINGSDAPGLTVGPMPAAFGTDTITFSNPDHAYVINRLTGTFIDTKINWKWDCQPGRKLF